MLKNDVSRISDPLRLPTQTGRASSAARYGTTASGSRVLPIGRESLQVHTRLMQQRQFAQKAPADAFPGPFSRSQCAARQERWKPQSTTRGKLQTSLPGPTCARHTDHALSRSCTSPEVCRGTGKVYYDSVVLGRLSSATISQQSGASKRPAPVWSRCQSIPEPLFDSRAAAAAAACCCTHVATADTASPSRWTGFKDLERSCAAASSVTSTQVSTEVLKTSEVAETPHVSRKQFPLCNGQEGPGATDVCEISKPSAQPAKQFRKSAAFGCTVSTGFQERTPTPAGGIGCGTEQSAISCDGSVPLDTEDEVIAWMSSSTRRSPWQSGIFDIPLPPPPRLEPDTNRFLAEHRTLQRNSHTGVSARRRARQTFEPCWQPKGGLDASTQPVDNNQNQFEVMLESLVKVLVPKAIEQSVEEIEQEQQLLSLLQRKQELLQQQEKGLREFEEREAFKQVKSQRVPRDQLAV
ncbi:hypothetical protein ACSSS7_005376 [Eimeria intestinalis]